MRAYLQYINAKFCPECGAKLQTKAKCAKCGAKIQPGPGSAPSEGRKCEDQEIGFL